MGFDSIEYAKVLFRNDWNEFCEVLDIPLVRELEARMEHLAQIIMGSSKGDWFNFVETLPGYIDYVNAYRDLCEANIREGITH